MLSFPPAVWDTTRRVQRRRDLARMDRFVEQGGAHEDWANAIRIVRHWLPGLVRREGRVAAERHSESRRGRLAARMVRFWDGDAWGLRAGGGLVRSWEPWNVQAAILFAVPTVAL